MPNCNNINPLIIIANIANFLISLNSRPSFKIRRLKSDEIRLKSAVRNKSPIAVKTPFPIGNPSLSPRKNGIMSVRKSKFQTTIVPIANPFLIGNPIFAKHVPIVRVVHHQLKQEFYVRP